MVCKCRIFDALDEKYVSKTLGEPPMHSDQVIKGGGDKTVPIDRNE